MTRCVMHCAWSGGEGYNDNLPYADMLLSAVVSKSYTLHMIFSGAVYRVMHGVWCEVPGLVCPAWYIMYDAVSQDPVRHWSDHIHTKRPQVSSVDQKHIISNTIMWFIHNTTHIYSLMWSTRYGPYVTLYGLYHSLLCHSIVYMYYGTV